MVYWRGLSIPNLYLLEILHKLCLPASESVIWPEAHGLQKSFSHWCNGDVLRPMCTNCLQFWDLWDSQMMGSDWAISRLTHSKKTWQCWIPLAYCLRSDWMATPGLGLKHPQWTWGAGTHLVLPLNILPLVCITLLGHGLSTCRVGTADKKAFYTLLGWCWPQSMQKRMCYDFYCGIWHWTLRIVLGTQRII